MSATTSASPTATAAPFDVERQRAIARDAIAKRSFCTLATASAGNVPHVAGVLYAEVDGALYVSMFEDSIKARNIRHNPRVAVCIPARKLPFFPPFVVHYQGRADILTPDDADIIRLFEAGALKKIVKQEHFEDPHTCFARIAPPARVSTFGLGVPLLQVVREPTSAIRGVDF
jgi:hypothetical protein